MDQKVMFCKPCSCSKVTETSRVLQPQETLRNGTQEGWRVRPELALGCRAALSADSAPALRRTVCVRKPGGLLALRTRNSRIFCISRTTRLTWLAATRLPRQGNLTMSEATFSDPVGQAPCLGGRFSGELPSMGRKEDEGPRRPWRGECTLGFCLMSVLPNLKHLAPYILVHVLQMEKSRHREIK